MRPLGRGPSFPSLGFMSTPAEPRMRRVPPGSFFEPCWWASSRPRDEAPPTHSNQSQAGSPDLGRLSHIAGSRTMSRHETIRGVEQRDLLIAAAIVSLAFLVARPGQGRDAGAPGNRPRPPPDPLRSLRRARGSTGAKASRRHTWRAPDNKPGPPAPGFRPDHHARRGRSPGTRPARTERAGRPVPGAGRPPCRGPLPQPVPGSDRRRSRDRHGRTRARGRLSLAAYQYHRAPRRRALPRDRGRRPPAPSPRDRPGQVPDPRDLHRRGTLGRGRSRTGWSPR